MIQNAFVVGSSPSSGHINEFGFNSPILVDSKAGIIAGHGRLLAARQLNLADVPVIVLDHLAEAHKRAYILADNGLALNASFGFENKGIAATRGRVTRLDQQCFQDLPERSAVGGGGCRSRAI